MVNLLPQKTQRALRMFYYVRLLDIVFFVSAGVLLVGAAFLLPSYLLAVGDANSSAQFLAASQKSANLASHANAQAILSQFKERVNILASYIHDPIAAKIFSALTETLPKGVYLTHIDYGISDTGPGTISVSGKANTRDELLAYVTALQGTALFTGVHVPVSNLANETNVPFSLSFFLLHTP